jgi:hypothetical protein
VSKYSFIAVDKIHHSRSMSLGRLWFEFKQNIVAKRFLKTKVKVQQEIPFLEKESRGI